MARLLEGVILSERGRQRDNGRGQEVLTPIKYRTHERRADGHKHGAHIYGGSKSEEETRGKACSIQGQAGPDRLCYLLHQGWPAGCAVGSIAVTSQLCIFIRCTAQASILSSLASRVAATILLFE